MDKLFCKKCGSCCKVFVVDLVRDPPKDNLIWFKNHGIKVIDKKLIIPVKCKYQSEHNLCMIQQRKPTMCKNFNCEKDLFFKKIKEELKL